MLNPAVLPRAGQSRNRPGPPTLITEAHQIGCAYTSYLEQKQALIACRAADKILLQADMERMSLRLAC